MQDSDLLVSLFEERNRSGRLDYELQRKRSNQHRVHSQPLEISVEGETDEKVKRRQQRSSKYEPSMSDRESWWRVTIRVRFLSIQILRNVNIDKYRTHQSRVLMIHI